MMPIVEAKTAQDRKREKGHTTKLEEREMNYMGLLIYSADRYGASKMGLL